MRLALDTSTLTTSLALVEGGAPVEEVLLPPPARQSAVLPQAIDALLGRHGVAPASLEGFVVGLGPGSFTGLRVGLATMKGLAYAVERPLVGASSLAAVALDGPEGVELFTCAVVKRGELYLGRYVRRGDAVEALAPESWLTVEAFAATLSATPGAKAVGPGLATTRERLLELGVDAARLLETPLVPRAAAVAKLAQLPAAWDKAAAFALEPHYLRGSGAEENPKFPPLPGVEPKARLKDD